MNTTSILVNSRYRERVGKVCKYCQQPFYVQPSKVDRIHMCASCRTERYHPPVNLTCQFCEEPFTRKGYDTKAKYCSVACKWQAKRGQPSGRRVLQDRTCLECGITFRPVGFHTIYCGKACMVQSQHRARPEYECHSCGTMFYNDTGRTRPQFCGVTCRAHYMSGPRHPLWVVDRPVYDRGPGWDVLAEAIRQRDGHQCQRCGHAAGQRALDVHHIVPYRLTHNNHPDNLITLCPSCHKIVEVATNRLSPPSETIRA